MRWIRTRPIVVVLIALLAAVTAQAGDRWLHVRVAEHGGDETVNVNVPLSVVERMLPMIQVDQLRGGKLQLDIDDDLDGLDLSALLVELRDAPDAEYVTVRSQDESVRVAKEDGYLLVVAEESHRRGDEKVRVRVPLSVVDAMTSGAPGEIDLVAGLRALGDHTNEDLVFIESRDSTVRVWIDFDEAGR